jgi:hypothetical protein
MIPIHPTTEATSCGDHSLIPFPHGEKIEPGGALFIVEIDNDESKNES